MTDPSFSIFTVDAEQFLEHEDAGGQFVVVLDSSLGSTRVVGPLASMLDAMRQAAILSAALAEDDPQFVMAITVRIAPLIPADEAS